MNCVEIFVDVNLKKNRFPRISVDRRVPGRHRRAVPYFRPNTVHVSQSRPDSGLGVKVKVYNPSSVVPSSLGSGRTDVRKRSHQRVTSKVSTGASKSLSAHRYVFQKKSAPVLPAEDGLAALRPRGV